MSHLRYGGMVYRTNHGITTEAWVSGALTVEENTAEIVNAFESLEAGLIARGHTPIGRGAPRGAAPRAERPQRRPNGEEPAPGVTYTEGALQVPKVPTCYGY